MSTGHPAPHTSTAIKDMRIGSHCHGHSVMILHHLLSQQAVIKEIKKLIGELGKLGSNLNQIARYFNQGGIISSEMRTEIKKSLRDIYEMKYEVMRMAGDFRGSD